MIIALSPTNQQDMLIVILLKQTPSFILKASFFSAMTLVGIFFFDSSGVCFGQTLSTQSSQTSEALTVQQKIDRHSELVKAMRDEIRLITEAEMRFYLDGAEESYNWSDQWDTAVAALVPLREEFEMLAIDLFINNEDAQDAPDSLADSAFLMRKKLLDSDRDADTIAVLKKLLAIEPNHEQLKLDLGLSLLKTNQFAEANEIIDSIPPLVLQKLEGSDQKMLAIRVRLQSEYEKEKKILAAEADDDLPRVEITTTQGKIVVELFENEAPDTVGNFIQLVESDFYTNIIFHRVVAGFMAQTGLITQLDNNFQSKNLNYAIYDELKGGRGHFYGYLSMAKTDKPDSGGSQFFITFQPTVFLNGRHTVFGRVIQGMENAGRLEVTHLEKEEKDRPPEEVLIETARPDRILSAKVIRKRDHEYRPKKVTVE